MSNPHLFLLNMYLQGEWRQFRLHPSCFGTAAVGKAE